MSYKAKKSSIGTFSEFYTEQCNVCANELKPGDRVENINPDCDHFKSIGKVVNIKKIPQDSDRTAGNIVVYAVANNSSDFDPKEVNGTFTRGDTLEKTEIQLKKL